MASQRNETLFRCPYKGCNHSFKTKKQLRLHKINEDSHDYCEKCNVEFDSWDDMIQHRINSSRHLACKICGVDFKTKSGRERHVNQNHPVDQDLQCIACGENFVRAAGLMHHLENNLCQHISREQFTGHIQHKMIINNLLEDPNEAEKLRTKVGFFEVERGEEEAGALGAIRQLETDSGGVSLRGTDDYPDASLALYQFGNRLEENWKPIQPERDPAGVRVKKISQHFPDLPTPTCGVAPPGRSLSHGLERMEIKDSQSPGAISPVSGSTRGSLSGIDVVDSASLDLSMTSACTSRSAAQVLFPSAKATPMTAEVQAHLEQLQQDLRPTQNVFNTRFWDPSSDKYDPERFFNPMIEKYMCPFPYCEHCEDIPYDLEIHIRTDHRLDCVRCPLCLRMFKSTTALVAHCEAPNGRCKIAKTERFGQAIDTFSGGFLGATELMRPEDREEEGREIEENVPEEETKYKMKYIAFASTKPVDYKERKSKLLAGEGTKAELQLIQY